MAVSGTGVVLLVGGSVVMWSGLKNASVKDTLQSLLRGTPVPSGPSMLVNAGSGVGSSAAAGAAAGAGAAVGAQVAAKAQGYAGVPYKWGGGTPSGWDCSGFVTWVLHHDFGIALPNNVHTVTGQFYVWSGARTVPRASCRAGDLVCWTSHIGIATGPDTMMNAPKPGSVTESARIWSVPAPVIRRPVAYGG